METTLEQFTVDVSAPQPLCDSCSWLPVRYKVPKLGSFCSMGCIETELFGTGRCRWCSAKIDRTYTTVDSRLCTEECSQQYYAHVKGDRTAALGTGKRFFLWLEANQPETYNAIVGRDAALGIPKKLGRPTINHHVMTGAERVRIHRASKALDVTKVGLFGLTGVLPPEVQNVTK